MLLLHACIVIFVRSLTSTKLKTVHFSKGILLHPPLEMRGKSNQLGTVPIVKTVKVIS